MGSGVPVDRAAQLARLRRFLLWLTPAIFVFAVLEGFAFLAFQQAPDGLTAAMLFACGLWNLLALARLNRGSIVPVVAMVSISSFVIALSAVTILPYAAEPAILGPVLVVALALPYITGRWLRVLIVLSWLITIAVAALPEFVPVRPTAPAWFVNSIRIAAVGVGAALVLYLLWDFSSRLRDMVARFSESNEALREAQATVERVNSEMRRRVGELERRNREISLLSEMGELLQVSQTQAEAYQVIARSARSLFEGLSGGLFVLSEARDSLDETASWGDFTPVKRVFGSGECWALRRGRAHLVDDPVTQPLCPHIVEPWSSAYLCLPLIAQSETLGMLHLRSGPPDPSLAADSPLSLSDDRIQLALTVAEQIALALANFRLRETLRVQSIRDPLTGLFNRRYMEESLERELRRAGREHERLAIIMIDLDHLKRYNDDFGHEAGDMVLRAIGKLLQTNVRAEDVACRYGGEEFIVILPGTLVDDARRRAERIRQSAHQLSAIDHGLPPRPITLSAGVAAYPEHGNTVEQLLRAADAALYRAKSQGRDLVVLAEPDRDEG